MKILMFVPSCDLNEASIHQSLEVQEHFPIRKVYSIFIAYLCPNYTVRNLELGEYILRCHASDTHNLDNGLA